VPRVLFCASTMIGTVSVHPCTGARRPKTNPTRHPFLLITSFWEARPVPAARRVQSEYAEQSESESESEHCADHRCASAVLSAAFMIFANVAGLNLRQPRMRRS
jgi:hypothetical protein